MSVPDTTLIPDGNENISILPADADVAAFEDLVISQLMELDPVLANEMAKFCAGNYSATGSGRQGILPTYSGDTENPNSANIQPVQTDTLAIRKDTQQRTGRPLIGLPLVLHRQKPQSLLVNLHRATALLH